jgi:hypothetical protein
MGGCLTRHRDGKSTGARRGQLDSGSGAASQAAAMGDRQAGRVVGRETSVARAATWIGATSDGAVPCDLQSRRVLR